MTELLQEIGPHSDPEEELCRANNTNDTFLNTNTNTGNTNTNTGNTGNWTSLRHWGGAVHLQGKQHNPCFFKNVSLRVSLQQFPKVNKCYFFPWIYQKLSGERGDEHF